MDTKIKDIAAALRSTETMADQYVQRVQERVGYPVSNDEILAAINQISAKQLSMEKVIAKIKQRKN
jgi:hypothetical protein